MAKCVSKMREGGREGLPVRVLIWGTFGYLYRGDASCGSANKLNLCSSTVCSHY